MGIGKKAVFVYKAKNKTSVPLRPGRKTRMRAIWGKVTRTHGSRGGLRAKFKNNLPAQPWEGESGSCFTPPPYSLEERERASMESVLSSEVEWIAVFSCV